MNTKSLTEILKEINQNNLESLTTKEVEKLTSAILDELLFSTESVHNNLIVTKERKELILEIIKELISVGIKEWCDMMAWSTFKALQLAERGF